MVAVKSETLFHTAKFDAKISVCLKCTNYSMESALYGIFTVVGQVSEISLVSCAHSFVLRYFRNSHENPVHARFPRSKLYIIVIVLQNMNTLKPFYQFCDSCKILHGPSISKKLKKKSLSVYMVSGDTILK